jgi:alkanesulfonate monooxygenase SsuD/methylene tetrahydromethanopterin reductase-like flavin-dependent oxidoreductase (luciferase family)
VPLVDLHCRAAIEAGHVPATLPFAINAHAFLATDAHAAADTSWPFYAATMNKLVGERGGPPMTRGQYDQMRGRRGSLLVGDPEYAMEKILFQHELFGHERHLAQFSVGTIPHADMMKAIELFGTRVAPQVRAEVARRTAPAPV